MDTYSIPHITQILTFKVNNIDESYNIYTVVLYLKEIKYDFIFK